MRILVLCTGNSCRSQMAHGYLRHFAGPSVEVLSAGVETHGVNPRAIAIMNGTLAGAVGLGLRLWLVGIAIWAIGHVAAVWAAKRDPLFVDVVRRHLRIPAHLAV